MIIHGQRAFTSVKDNKFEKVSKMKLIFVSSNKYYCPATKKGEILREWRHNMQKNKPQKALVYEISDQVAVDVDIRLHNNVQKKVESSTISMKK